MLVGNTDKAIIHDLESRPRIVGEPFKLEKRKDTHICGDANKNGNVEMTYKGGCRAIVILEDVYRCGGCGGWFHKECMYKHFELEKSHDYGRTKAYKEAVDGFVEYLFKDRNGKYLTSDIVNWKAIILRCKENFLKGSDE